MPPPSFLSFELIPSSSIPSSSLTHAFMPTCPKKAPLAINSPPRIKQKKRREKKKRFLRKWQGTPLPGPVPARRNLDICIANGVCNGCRQIRGKFTNEKDMESKSLFVESISLPCCPKEKKPEPAESPHSSTQVSDIRSRWAVDAAGAGCGVELYKNSFQVDSGSWFGREYTFPHPDRFRWVQSSRSGNTVS